MSGVTAEEFKRAMASFAVGVTVVTTLDNAGAPRALTATAFSSLSKTPPLCLVCVDRKSRAHAPILASRRFAINMLSAEQAALSERFADSTIEDKFAGVDWFKGARTGCPVLAGALCSLECELVEVHAGGDHDIFVGRLLAVAVDGGAPLVYFRGGYAALSITERERERTG